MSTEDLSPAAVELADSLHLRDIDGSIALLRAADPAVVAELAGWEYAFDRWRYARDGHVYGWIQHEPDEAAGYTIERHLLFAAPRRGQSEEVEHPRGLDVEASRAAHAGFGCPCHHSDPCPDAAPEGKPPVVDLMAALEKSVAEARAARRGQS